MKARLHRGQPVPDEDPARYRRRRAIPTCVFENAVAVAFGKLRRSSWSSSYDKQLQPPKKKELAFAKLSTKSILPSQINVVPLCQQSPKRKCGWVAETNSLLNCRTGNRTGGSNPPASAVKGVNQRVTWFTPFFAPKKSLVGIFDSATSMVLCFSMSI